MIRWITFGAQTAKRVLERLPEAAVEIRSEQPLEVALSLTTPSLLVLPSKTAGKVLLAHITHGAQKPAISPEPERLLAFEPSGFLGLSDIPVIEEEPQTGPRRKRWRVWRRAA